MDVSTFKGQGNLFIAHCGETLVSNRITGTRKTNSKTPTATAKPTVLSLMLSSSLEGWIYAYS